MRRVSFRIALVVGMFAWPLGAAAFLPANVTNLSAQYANGQITMNWDAPEQNVITYRIYYGQKSILQNEGAYDDFVTTSGKNTSFIMTEIPAYPEIFLGVVAVNAEDEESSSFVEEVQLSLTAESSDGQKSSHDVPSPSRREREATTIGLIDAVATSPTTIQMTFTAPVRIPVAQAIDAFRVLDVQSNALPLYRITMAGNIVTLLTAPQIPGRTYAVRVGPVVTGQPTEGETLLLDAERSSDAFTGYGLDQEQGQPAAPTYVAPVASTTRPPKPSGALSNSGLSVLGVLAASGAIMGWKRFTRKATEATL